MFLNLKKVEHPKEGWIPCDEDTVKEYNKQKFGDEIYVEYKPRRNYQFHKKMFSMLNLVLNNQERFKTTNELLDAIKHHSGHTVSYYDIEGREWKKPKSIAFYAMDNDEFEKFYNLAIDACLLIVPMGKIELEKAILRYC